MKKGLKRASTLRCWMESNISVGRIDLMKKGLKHLTAGNYLLDVRKVGRIDLMKKGLKLPPTFCALRNNTHRWKD